MVRPPRMIQAIDVNKDGLISIAEFFNSFKPVRNKCRVPFGLAGSC